jgi:hypothetical protein
LKKLSLIAGGVASLGLATLLATHSYAADHGDSTTLLTNPLGDINDVYTWMNADASKINLVMTVSPVDPGTRAFTDAVQYVFHVTSKVGGPLMTVAQNMATDKETKVICTFASNTSAQCWVVEGTTVKGYISGDPSATTGLTSADGKIKMFAGRRSDPFFFNLQGFRNAITAIKGAAGLQLNQFGCVIGPAGLDPTFASLRTTLGTLQTVGTGVPACSTTEIDCFKAFNVMAIVLQVDKTLVNSGTNTVVSVWGSTHAKP